MSVPEPLVVSLEEGLKLLAERRDGRRISYEVDTPDGEPCWVAWERYVTLGPADSWEDALEIALEQPVVARDEAAEPKPIGWDDVTDEDFTAALLDCQEELKQARDEAAELRAATKALLDPETHDPAYDPTFGPGVPSMHAVDRARAALAASEGQP